MKEIKELVAISNHIGKFKELVQGGGGNTSVKTQDGRMLIKASGFTFSEITKNTGFAVLDRKLIIDFFDRMKGPCKEENEMLYNKSLTASIINPGCPRPSMESGMHAFLDRVVIHTHPVMINIITCSNNGKRIAKEIFSDLMPEILWIGYKSPGYNLAIEIKNKVLEYKSKNGANPEIIFLKNHGLIVSGNDPVRCAHTTFNLNKNIYNYLHDNLETGHFPKLKIQTNDRFYFSCNRTIKSFVRDLSSNRHYLSNFLLPDDVIYCSKFAIQKSSDKLEADKINFVGKKGVFYPWVERRSTNVDEILTAKLYILENLSKIGRPYFLRKKDVNYLLRMESEKYRQIMG